MRLKRIEIRINDFEFHCIEVLKKKYHINPSHFIREAFQEKLKRDMPMIRENNKEKLPF